MALPTNNFEAQLTPIMGVSEEIPTAMADARVYSLLHGHKDNPYIDHDRHTTYADHAEVSYTVTTVRDPESTPWRILTPGFCGVENSYMDLANEQALRGETVVTLKPARHQGISSLSPRNILHPENLLAQEVIAVADDLYNRYGVKQVEVDGHSMGGPAAVRAAEIISRREKGIQVGKLALFEAAGVTNHNMGQLGINVPAIWAEALRLAGKHPDLVLDTLRHFYTNLLRTSGEMIEVSHCRISPERLAGLTEFGITTAAVYHRRDRFFPAQKAFAEIGEAVHNFQFGSRGGHLAPLTFPREFSGDLQQSDTELRWKQLQLVRD